MELHRLIVNRVYYNLAVTLLLLLVTVFTFSFWRYTQHISIDIISFSTPPISSVPPNDVSTQFSDLPHVDLCHTCKSCSIPEFERSSSRRLLTGADPSTRLPQGIRLGQVFNKQDYPDCEACWGCQHNLTRLPQTRSAFGLDDAFEVEKGLTAADIYQIQDPLNHELHIVKLWGINPDDRSISEHSIEHIMNSVKLSLGFQKLVDEAGFRDIVSNIWLAPVDGVIPESGIRVNWDGLWSDYAEGLSVSSFTNKALEAGMDPPEFEEFLNQKINSTEIKMAAILDLLTCQGDRHSANVFINEQGHLTLIDNDQILGHSWRTVSVDSIFLPTTQFHTAQHVGLEYARKESNESRDQLVPPVVFDYRCHVPEGVIGFDFPPKLLRVLRRIAEMSVEHVMEHYYLPDSSSSSRLIQRARDLLEFGFEWTLENGEPKNPASLKYPPHPPCCSIRVDPESLTFECNDVNYERNYFRPEGEALYPEE